MKKLLFISILCICVCACSTYKERNIVNALAQNDWLTVRAIDILGKNRTTVSSMLATHYIELAKQNGGNKENLCRA